MEAQNYSVVLSSPHEMVLNTLFNNIYSSILSKSYYQMLAMREYGHLFFLFYYIHFSVTFIFIRYTHKIQKKIIIFLLGFILSISIVLMNWKRKKCVICFVSVCLYEFGVSYLLWSNKFSCRGSGAGIDIDSVKTCLSPWQLENVSLVAYFSTHWRAFIFAHTCLMVN